MQVDLVPFHALHLELMELREQERIYAEHLPDWPQRVRASQQSGNGLTLLIDGVPIASAGIHALWAGTSELWMLTSKRMEMYPAVCSRMAARAVDRIVQSDGARRVQIAVNARDARALRFAKFLQFDPEGVLKAYGPDGSDYVMFARLNDGQTIRRWRRRRPEGHDDAADGHAATTAGQAGCPGA